MSNFWGAVQTGPIPFETLVNKYNQTGSHVTKDFKLNGNWGPWMNTGKDYLSWWHISINGDATKADLSQLVIRDQMNGTVVTDFSGFTNGAGQTIDYASLFNGSYLKQSFSLVRNGQVVANSSQIMDVIEWSDNGFTLDLTKVDASFATPSQDQIVLSYMTLIPFGTAEITNVASFTSAEYPEVKTDTAYWKNATGEAIYDASSTTTEEPSTSTTTEEPSASTTTTEELSTSSTTESNMAGGVTPLSGTQKKVLPSTGERTSATVILVGISSFVFGLYSFRKNNIK
ncbi:LPXTG cell wall anchor domain-containing protein [Streptococcus suis]|nr:LPXTG cell wall anchor domain-containing protein [Streptococcus suis]